MKLVLQRRFVGVLTLLTFLFIGLMSIKEFLKKDQSPLKHYKRDTSSSLLVDTEGCKIPYLNPYDKSVNSFLGSGSELTCSENEDIVYAKESSIFINWILVRQRLPTLKYCKYDVIWRPTNVQTDHNFFQFINESQAFSSNLTINADFIRVRCFNSNNAVVYTNAFSFVQHKPSVEKQCMENFRKHSQKNHLSILMVGIDSVSRNNMLRYMPMTREYLLKNMSGLEYLGYNKVDDNTFLNIVPMTTGKFVRELPWNASSVDVSFDRFEFIWNRYSKKGYRTLYSEDAPYGQIFDYEKAGFKKPPADYFDRPLSLVLEEMSELWNNNHHCVHARPETEIPLEFTKQFVHTFKKLPYFSFTFVTRLTHDSISDLKRADILYYNFLKSINIESTLNSTIFLFFSDHGLRFGQMRQTFIGKIEERLPFLFLILPEWFKSKYPDFYKNLNINTKRLITPFDIFETLNHILDFNEHKCKPGRGMSILHEIPTSRRCEDAGILPHWCTCLQQKFLAANDTVVRKAASHFIEKMNAKIARFKECETLRLKEILTATELIPSNVILKYVQTYHEKERSEIQYGDRVTTYIDYQISLQTFPGDGMFEVTMRFDESRSIFDIMGDFSRINMYGKTSHCVDGIELKKICYCKVQNN